MTNKVTFFVVCVEKPKGALASQHSDDSAGCKFFSGGGTERAIAYSMTLVAGKVSTMVKSVPDLTSARTYLVELLMTPWTKSSDACKAIVMAIYQQERGKCILEIGDTSPQWWMNLEKAMEESEKVMRTADQVDQNQGLPNEQQLIAQGHRNLIRLDY